MLFLGTHNAPMKYHFQFVSKTTVRIELIAEDKKETTLIEKLAQAEDDNAQLIDLYNKALKAYNGHTTLIKVKFMNFPRVALCNYTTLVEAIENVA